MVSYVLHLRYLRPGQKSATWETRRILQSIWVSSLTQTESSLLRCKILMKSAVPFGVEEGDTIEDIRDDGNRH